VSHSLIRSFSQSADVGASVSQSVSQCGSFVRQSVCSCGVFRMCVCIRVNPPAVRPSIRPSVRSVVRSLVGSFVELVPDARSDYVARCR